MKALGRLSDGTPYFAPWGTLPHDPDEQRVQCHLCGGWYRALGAAHLGRHGWCVSEYRDAFGLPASLPLQAAEVSSGQGIADELRVAYSTAAAELRRAGVTASRQQKVASRKAERGSARDQA